jgi:hypothetical protein
MEQQPAVETREPTAAVCLACAAPRCSSVVSLCAGVNRKDAAQQAARAPASVSAAAEERFVQACPLAGVRAACSSCALWGHIGDAYTQHSCGTCAATSRCADHCNSSMHVLLFSLCCCVPAGEVYEHAVLLALKSQNEAALESSFTQLKTFYADTRCARWFLQAALSAVGVGGMRSTCSSWAAAHPAGGCCALARVCLLADVHWLVCFASVFGKCICSK